jgi:hypothetical protein
MSRNEFEELKRLIEQGHVEHKEDILKLKIEIGLMRKSLKNCQSRCHVDNEKAK